MPFNLIRINAFYSQKQKYRKVEKKIEGEGNESFLKKTRRLEGDIACSATGIDNWTRDTTLNLGKVRLLNERERKRNI